MDYGECEVFASGFVFPEGPAFDREGNLYITDGKGGRIPKVDLKGKVSTFVESDGGPNGSAFHQNGELYVAEPEAKHITCVSPSGQTRVVAGEFEGEPFFGPNDITFDLLGRAFFTDPGESNVEDPYGRVFRIDPDGTVTRIAEGMAYPNGLAITPCGQGLIVAETFSEKLHRFSLDANGDAVEREEFAYVGTGRDGEVGPDGMAFDEDGYIHVAVFGGGIVSVVSRDGEVVEQLPAGGLRPTNAAFGGPDRKTLYVTETENRIVTAFLAPRGGLRLFGGVGPV
ncbi:MAG: SMP-30/gluconolactonase/LRE family protein [Chloroflexi bacterium]|nr:SMP-30/gluconolactonase/LRE family protein [Chloroflexota bacterium]